MTEQELFKVILPLINSYTEGIYWDFKETITDTSGIIKDILAFSNSDYDGDSYIIVGVKEAELTARNNKVKLSNNDRIRLNTDSIYLYLPNKYKLTGLSYKDIEKMKQFSAQITQQLESSMLISIPKCEFMPLQLNKTRWIYVIIVKKTPGVFISKKDLSNDDKKKIDVKQGVIYVRVADTTLGADTNIASATEHIRIWKNYIDWLESPTYQKEENVESEQN